MKESALVSDKMKKNKKGEITSISTVITMIVVLILITVIFAFVGISDFTGTTETSFEETKEEEFVETLYVCNGLNRQSSHRVLYKEKGNANSVITAPMFYNIENISFECNVPGTSEPDSGCVIESLERKQKVMDGCDEKENIGWIKFNFTKPRIGFNYTYPCSPGKPQNGLFLEKTENASYLAWPTSRDDWTNFFSNFHGEIHKNRLMFEADGVKYNWTEATNYDNYLIGASTGNKIEHWNAALGTWELVDSIKEGEKYALIVLRDCKMYLGEDLRNCFYNNTYSADVFDNFDVMSVFVPSENKSLINSYFCGLQKESILRCINSNSTIREICEMDPEINWYYCSLDDYTSSETFYDWEFKVKGYYCCPESGPIKTANDSLIYDESGNPIEEKWKWKEDKNACCLERGCKNLPCIEEGGKWMYGECWFNGTPGQSCEEVCNDHQLKNGENYTCVNATHWERVPKNCELHRKFGFDCTSCSPSVNFAPYETSGNCRYFDYELYAAVPVDDYDCSSSNAALRRFCACE